jgi:type IV pilus assembly protein PilV
MYELVMKIKKQNGSSLLEVLITLLIISFGLLGIAGILINSLKNNQSAYSRTQASILANDIIDRMRANKTAAETSPYPYNIALDGTPSGSGVVLNDLNEWRASLTNIPSGTGSVALDAVTKKITVIVQWDDSRASGDNAVIEDRTTVGLSNQTIKIESRL